jgi:hypothetical protein
MELENAARRVGEVGVELVEVARRLRPAGPPAAAFGADGSGAFGELGRALAGQATGAINARAAEATALSDAASTLAATVAGGASGYRDVDHRRGGSARSGGA